MDTKNAAPAVTMSADQFNQLLEAVKAGGGGNDAVAEAMMEMAKAQQRTVRQSNAYHPGISPFSYPEGEEARPKPKLDRETWWMGTRAEDAQLTPDEVEAFNKVTTNKVWRGDPKFGSEVTPKRRFIMLPHVSIDERMALPPNIPLAIRELLGGEDAMDPIKMEQEIRAMAKDMAALKQQLNTAMATEGATLQALAKQLPAEY